MSIQLFAHQSRFVEIARDKRRYLWAAEPGCGKTLGTLAVCAERPLKTVVLAPISILESAWAADAANFPTLRVVPLFADSKHRASTIVRGEWDVLAMGYEMFKKHAKDLEAAFVRRLVVDESSKLRNPDSAITRAVVAFADRMSEVFLLSGTPAPNGTHEYYGQLRAIGATTLPAIKWLYRTHYPVKEMVRVRGGKVRPVVKAWKQTPAQACELQETLRKCSWALSKAECLDLPPQLDRIIRVRLSDAETEAYRLAERELRLTLTDGATLSIKAGAALVKLRQLVGGGALADGVFQYVGDSKIRALSDLLDEIGPQPVVIWMQFRHERHRIEKLLAERGETFGVIDGETSGDAGVTAAMFQAGRLQRLIAHPAAAGHGLTLHRASHAVYFALDFSHDGHKQSRDRIHRAGMGDTPASYHYLLAELPGTEADARKTVDDSMLWTLKQKAKAADGMAMALRDAGVAAGVEQGVGA